MENTFKIWKQNRNLYLDFFEKYTLEELNKIPVGFSNNLIWNIGHVIVCQQVLVYKSSNLQGYLSQELVELYKPGTKPTEKTSENEIKELKKLLISLIYGCILNYDLFDGSGRVTVYFSFQDKKETRNDCNFC